MEPLENLGFVCRYQFLLTSLLVYNMNLLFYMVIKMLTPHLPQGRQSIINCLLLKRWYLLKALDFLKTQLCISKDVCHIYPAFLYIVKIFKISNIAYFQKLDGMESVERVKWNGRGKKKTKKVNAIDVNRGGIFRQDLINQYSNNKKNKIWEKDISFI